MDKPPIPNNNLLMNNIDAQINDNNNILNVISISNRNVNHIKIIPKNSFDVNK